MAMRNSQGFIKESRKKILLEKQKINNRLFRNMICLLVNVLLSIKSDIDQKVYDRNDILKKDAYFERTVMTQIKSRH